MIRVTNATCTPPSRARPDQSKGSRDSAISLRTPTHAPLHVPSLQRRVTTPMSGRTPVPGSALRPSPQRAYMVHVLIRHPSLPSGQTTAKKCPRIRYQAEPAAAQTPTVSGVDAPGVLSAWPPNLRALPLATVPCSPPRASGQPAPSPARATAS